MMTETQKRQFNRMRKALRTIANDFSTIEQLEEECAGLFGLNFKNWLIVEYNRIRETARNAVRGVREAK